MLRFLWSGSFLVLASIWLVFSSLCLAAEEYKKGELLLLFETSAQASMDSTLAASRANRTRVGMAALDSLALAHQLQSIVASPQADISPFARRIYTLIFPVETDIAAIAKSYAKLAAVKSAEPNFIARVQTSASINQVLGPNVETKPLSLPAKEDNVE